MPLLLCDLDNTLVDREAAFHSWALELAQRHGLPSDETVTALHELDNDGYVPRERFVDLVARRCGIWEDRPAGLAEYRRGIVAHQAPPPAGVLRALADLRSDGWRIAIVTNGDTWQQTAKIERTGLTQLVDAVVVSGEAACCKPEARIFEIAAERARASLTGAWMIGDHPECDIAGAGAAGLCTVWLHRGRTWTMSAVGPTLEAGTMLEALDLLRACPAA